MSMMDEDYQSRLRDMVMDRLDEAVSSPHFLHSPEPMVPILQQMCSNLHWLVSGADKTSESALNSVSALRRLLKEKPKRECDTDRLISLVADALLIHLTAVIAQASRNNSTPTKLSAPATPSSLTSSPFTLRSGGGSGSSDSSAPALKRARLEAKINGLAQQQQQQKSSNGHSSSRSRESPLPLFSDLPISSMIKREPMEIIRVGGLEGSPDEDNNDDSGMMMDSSCADENPLIRLLKEQERMNGKSPIQEMTPMEDELGLEEEADGSGEEEGYDFSALLMNNDGTAIIQDMPDFEDPFINEPPIFSPSVSTIRKNTRRSKPEKIAEKGCTRVNRDPNAPRQVISAYLCFVGEMRMRRNNGDLQCNGGEFGQLLKSEWIKLPDKTRYEMQHEEDKRRYESELAAWARSERRPVPGRKAYSFYVLEHFDNERNDNPDVPEEEIIMKVFMSWRDLADKSKYFQLQQRDKERYRNEMKVYTARLAQNGVSGMAPGQVTMTTKQNKMSTLREDQLKNDLQMYLKNAEALGFEA